MGQNCNDGQIQGITSRGCGAGGAIRVGFGVARMDDTRALFPDLGRGSSAGSGRHLLYGLVRGTYPGSRGAREDRKVRAAGASPVPLCTGIV